MNFYKFNNNYKHKLNKTFLSILITSILLFSNSIYLFANNNTTYVWANKSHKLETTETGASNLNSSISTVTDNPLNLECGSACLIDQNSGSVLYDYNMHEPLRPASVTKVMSLLLIMEALDSGKINLDDKVPCTEDAANMGGSQIWLDVKETLTVDEMLKAICVVSANDCVVAMADYISGNQEAFVNKMNDRAKELGMNDTCFKNCHGIDEDGHLTSAYDIAIMSRELLLNHPSITNYTTIWMDSLREGKSQLVNTNKLVRNYKGCTGLKTGSTSIALYNLSASATRDDLSLIGVIMKSPTTKLRFENAKKLLDYGFNNYSIKSFGKKGDIIKNIKVNKGSKQSVDAILEKNAEILINNKNSKEINKEIILDDTINAPILENQKLGELKLTTDKNEIFSVNIVAKERVDKLTYTNILRSVFSSWFNLLRF